MIPDAIHHLQFYHPDSENPNGFCFDTPSVLEFFRTVFAWVDNNDRPIVTLVNPEARVWIYWANHNFQTADAYDFIISAYHWLSWFGFGGDDESEILALIQAHYPLLTPYSPHTRQVDILMYAIWRERHNA